MMVKLCLSRILWGCDEDFCKFSKLSFQYVVKFFMKSEFFGFFYFQNKTKKKSTNKKNITIQSTSGSFLAAGCVGSLGVLRLFWRSLEGPGGPRLPAVAGRHSPAVTPLLMAPEA